MFNMYLNKGEKNLFFIHKYAEGENYETYNEINIWVSFITIFFSASAFAVTVSWTDWTSSDSFSANGDLLVGSTTVGVGYSATGAHSFVTTGAGTNFWTGAAYTNGTVDNAPPASDIIALNVGGTVTVTFAQTIVDPYIGLVSWNGNTVDFGVPIEIDSFGSGFWGSGVLAHPS